jgi:hypothetical protein
VPFTGSLAWAHGCTGSGCEVRVIVVADKERHRQQALGPGLKTLIVGDAHTDASDSGTIQLKTFPFGIIHTFVDLATDS